MKRFFPTTILLCLVLVAFIPGSGCSVITGSTPENKTTTTTSPPTTSSFRVEDITIIVEPCRDDPEGKISLTNVKVEKGILDKDYWSPAPGKHMRGDPCFLITGIIRNDYDKYLYVAYRALGWDQFGNGVSVTLDSSPIIGLQQSSIGAKSTDHFILHQTWSENVSVFRVYSQKSDIMFP